MNYFASPKFWFHYRQLDADVRGLADKSFQLLKVDPTHRSLRFKKIGHFRPLPGSANRIAISGGGERASGRIGLVWFWIGPHDEYDNLLKQAD